MFRIVQFFICSVLILGTASFNNVFAQVDLTPHQQAEMFQSLSPEQSSAVAAELNKSGGTLTPESINTLKEKQEFKDLSPEDIMKGKNLLEGKDAVEKEAGKAKGPEVTLKSESNAVSRSLFSRYRTVGPYQGISTDLLPFGYEFFSGTDNKLSSRKDLPVSQDYVIGPGDEVKILLWGRVNEKYDLVVDRDGNITVPQIGPLQVNGMSFNELRSFLGKQANQIVGANINVTMGTLKSIQVFVLGEVRRPGSYSLGSFSTIAGALLAAGGPTEIGSLRNIQLKRNNKLLGVMDFYDFLLKGDKSGDKILQSGDVVFVATSGPLVGLAGNVRRPAIYELKSKYDLMSLFDIAGGLIPSAYTQQIQVERIQKNERQIVIDINDKDLTRSKEIMLQDGDLVKVFSIVDKDVNVVVLDGNVKRPGKYEYKPGMVVKDLIGSASNLLMETYLEYALIKRQKLPGMEAQLIPFNLGKLIFDNDEASNIKLEPQDSVYIFSKWVFGDKPSITVEGEVRKKGDFDLLDNYKVRDAVLEAGGLSKDASQQKGEIFRTDEYGQIQQIYFNVDKALAEDPADNVLLQDKDRIVIHSIWEENEKPVVSIDGDIKIPGEYPLTDGMRVSDLVFTAGNVLTSAYLDNAELASFSIDPDGKFRTDYRMINLSSVLNNDPSHNILLRPKDRLFIKRVPNWEEKKFVTISGEINFPGNYIIQKGERLTSLIERAGGYTEKAYLKGAVFTRENVRKIQQQSLREMITKLERELLSQGSLQVSTALSKEEIDSKKIELEQKQKFLESLKTLEATGRLTLRLAHLRLLKGSEYDIELEEGDSLNIPIKNSIINVTGSVMSKSSFVYSEKLGYRDYIEMAGGYNDNANESSTYVLKVDGSAKKLNKGFINWNNSNARWETDPFGEDLSELDPGDTIVVPERLERVAWLRDVKDITQILYQIAVTAGVLIVAF